MCDRIISFASIPNARDLGGLTTTRGQRIRRGLLLRSASLHGAAEPDIRTLKDHYHLKKVIDLRTEMERQEKPVEIEAAVLGALMLEKDAFSLVCSRSNSKSYFRNSRNQSR